MKSNAKASTSSKLQRQKLGVMMPTWVGDACMATPTLRALRKSYPKAHIIGVMSPLIRELVSAAWGEHQPWFDEFIAFHKRRTGSKNAGSADSATSSVHRWRLAKVLRSHRIDTMLLMTNAWWAAAVSRLAGIRSIVGYDRDARRIFLSDALPVPTTGDRQPKPISAVDYYLELARWVGAQPESHRMQLAVSPQDELLTEELWRTVGFSAREKTVVINSSAAKDSSRVWPADYVRDLAVRLALEDKLQVMIHCGPKERAAANRVVAEANHPRIASMGVLDELPIGLSRGVLANSSVVVSSDSGVRHMAVALERPVVSLFGPTDPAWTTTYNRPEVMLAETMDCRPCYQSQCPLQHHRCMREIPVQRVLDAVRQQLMVSVPLPMLADRAA